MPKCEKQAKTYGFADSIMLARDIHSDLVKAFHPHRRLSEYAGWTGMKLMNTVNDTQNSSISVHSRILWLRQGYICPIYSVIANKLNSNGQALSITPKLQQWDYLIMIGRQWTYGSSVELSVLWYPPVTVGSYNNYPAKSLIVYNCSKSPSAYVSLVYIYIVNQ
ncbi:unnamed protein product [Schistosoma turkestanicum]|nr:unnamed protein product [Schistosoma turkestanicum]